MKIAYTGEMDPRLCKEVLGATIEKIVTEDENTIYLDADLMSCCGTLKWAKQNPERAIDCGIAEAENTEMNHSMPINDERYARWMAELQADLAALEG